MTRIRTDGYRGITFGNIFIPAGEYEVGDSLDIAGGVIDGAQAAHMLAIGRAVAVEAPVLAQSEPPTGPSIDPPDDDVLVEAADDGESEAVAEDDDVLDEGDQAENEPYVEGTSIYEQFTVAEMRAIADERGLDLTGLRVRGDIIQALDAADRAEAE